MEFAGSATLWILDQHSKAMFQKTTSEAESAVELTRPL